MKKIVASIINLIKKIITLILTILKKTFSGVFAVLKAVLSLIFLPLKKLFGGPKSKKKLLIIAILLLLLAVIGYLTGLIGPERDSESSGEKKTENVQKENEEEKTENADLGDLESRLASDFIKTLRSDEYMIRYKTTTVYEGESFEVETTYAVSGSSIALVSGDRATIISEEKVHMLNHTEKSMISWNLTETDNLKKIDTEDLVYAGSTQEGSLVCEAYQTATAEIKLYFDGDKLVRMATRINGMDTVMGIEEVKEKAPADLFRIPGEYRNTNLSQ